MKSEISLVQMWSVLRGNYKYIAASSLLTALVAAIYCIFATPIYSAKLLINPPKLSDAGGVSLSQAMGGFQNVVASYGGLVPKTDSEIVTTMMKTNAVKDMVINKFDLVKIFGANDIEMARDILSQKVEFIPNMKSGFLEVDVYDSNPKLAAQIANYYSTAVGQLINDVAYAKSNQRYEFYQHQLSVALANLSNSESALKQFTKTHVIIAPHQVKEIEGIAIQIQAKLVATQMQLQSMKHYANVDNPDYKALEAQIDTYKSELVKLDSPESGDDWITVGNSSEVVNQYLNLVRDFNFKEVVYGVLLRQSKGAQLDLLSEINPLAIEVIDPALIPLHKSKPARLKILLCAILFGFLVGCIFVTVKNKSLFIYKK